MTKTNSADEYAFGNTAAEHERLIRQSARLASLTERFFREAGISAGHRVLDLGSGVGDVATLAAQIVGPSGEVLGIERDPHTIARARAPGTRVWFGQRDLYPVRLERHRANKALRCSRRSLYSDVSSRSHRRFA